MAIEFNTGTPPTQSFTMPETEGTQDTPQGPTTRLTNEEAQSQTPGLPNEQLVKDQSGNVFDMQDPNNPRKVGKLENGKLQRDDSTMSPQPGGQPEPQPAMQPQPPAGGGSGGGAPSPAADAPPPPPPGAGGGQPSGTMSDLPPDTQVKGTPQQGERLMVDDNNQVFDMRDPKNPKPVGKMENGEVVRNDQPQGGGPNEQPKPPMVF